MRSWEISPAAASAPTASCCSASRRAAASREYAARQAKRYGGVAGLSAGLIGPPSLTRNDRGSLEDTPVFLGCSDIDPHIPLDRVHFSTKVLTAMNAVVAEQIYPGMRHTINPDEIAHMRRLLERVNRARDAGKLGPSSRSRAGQRDLPHRNRSGIRKHGGNMLSGCWRVRK
jgi:hypothetical protein